MDCCEGSHPISCLVGSENWILRSHQPLYISDTPLRNKVYTLIPLEAQSETFLWFFPPPGLLGRNAHRRFGWRSPLIEKSTFLFEPLCVYSFILTPEVMFTPESLASHWGVKSWGLFLEVEKWVMKYKTIFRVMLIGNMQPDVLGCGGRWNFYVGRREYDLYFPESSCTISGGMQKYRSCKLHAVMRILLKIKWVSLDIFGDFKCISKGLKYEFYV